MNQPTKDQLKDQLALAAEEIIRARQQRETVLAAAILFAHDVELRRAPWAMYLAGAAIGVALAAWLP